ncbi:MAG TPA: response regulator [Longimicrobiales bacterium]|nr:response regulator [Longimicrobiales bacterium]
MDTNRKKLILVVDDDPNSREIVQTFLESRGYSVVTVPTGESALAAVQEETPDLILLDVMMPGMDGWEVARTLKDHADYAGIRVVMMTARSDFSDKQKGLQAGADDYIVKPIQLEDLGKTVKRNLEVRSRR